MNQNIVFIPGISRKPTLESFFKEQIESKGFSWNCFEGWSNPSELGSKTFKELSLELNDLLKSLESPRIFAKSFGSSLLLLNPLISIQKASLWAPACFYQPNRITFDWMNQPLQSVNLSQIQIDSPACKKVKFPIQIIHGSADETVQLSNSEQLSKHLPHAHLKIIEGANHSDQLELVSKAMTEFLLE